MRGCRRTGQVFFDGSVNAEMCGEQIQDDRPGLVANGLCDAGHGLLVDVPGAGAVLPEQFEQGNGERIAYLDSAVVAAGRAECLQGRLDEVCCRVPCRHNLCCVVMVLQEGCSFQDPDEWHEVEGPLRFSCRTPTAKSAANNVRGKSSFTVGLLCVGGWLAKHWLRRLATRCGARQL